MYIVVGIAAVAFTGFLLMLVILKFGGNSKFGIKGKTPSVLFSISKIELLFDKSAGKCNMDGFMDTSGRKQLNSLYLFYLF